MSRFRFLVVLQIITILMIGSLFVWLLITTDLYMSTAIVGIVLIIAVIVLIHFVEETNRKLTRFLLAFEHADFSQSFSGDANGRSFENLAETMHGVLERFRDARSEREEQAIFLRTLVQHVPVALVALRSGGDITLFNNAAGRLFGVSNPRRIQSCNSLGENVIEAVLSIEAGQHSVLRVDRGGESVHLNLSATLLRQRGWDEKLVCIQDISSELEARELDAVQKLMRVLSHEVMNSITPITSLAETAAQDVAALTAEVSEKCRPESLEQLDDILEAVETIGRRGSGLTRFVNSYRQMTRIPEPAIGLCVVAQILGRTMQLMQDEAVERGVKVSVEVDPQSLEINADPELIEQALINLVRNALEAVKGLKEPVVRLSAQAGKSGQVRIAVADNGPGFSQEAQRNLFVPFFTTKKEGSGVGMSIVRQIMRSHGGTVGVECDAQAGTVVSLRF